MPLFNASLQKAVSGQQSGLGMSAARDLANESIDCEDGTGALDASYTSAKVFNSTAPNSVPATEFSTRENSAMPNGTNVIQGV